MDEIRITNHFIERFNLRYFGRNESWNIEDLKGYMNNDLLHLNLTEQLNDWNDSSSFDDKTETDYESSEEEDEEVLVKEEDEEVLVKEDVNAD